MPAHTQNTHTPAWPCVCVLQIFPSCGDLHRFRRGQQLHTRKRQAITTMGRHGQTDASLLSSAETQPHKLSGNGLFLLPPPGVHSPSETSLVLIWRGGAGDHVASWVSTETSELSWAPPTPNKVVAHRRRCWLISCC